MMSRRPAVLIHQDSNQGSRSAAQRVSAMTSGPAQLRCWDYRKTYLKLWGISYAVRQLLLIASQPVPEALHVRLRSAGDGQVPGTHLQAIAVGTKVQPVLQKQGVAKDWLASGFIGSKPSGSSNSGSLMRNFRGPGSQSTSRG